MVGKRSSVCRGSQRRYVSCVGAPVGHHNHRGPGFREAGKNRVLLVLVLNDGGGDRSRLIP